MGDKKIVAVLVGAWLLSTTLYCRRCSPKTTMHLLFKDKMLLSKITHLQLVTPSLKGQSNEIFDLQFFSPFEPAWSTDQWVKIFLIVVWFSLTYSNFSIEKTDSPGSKKKCYPRTMVQN